MAPPTLAVVAIVAVTALDRVSPRWSPKRAVADGAAASAEGLAAAGLAGEGPAAAEPLAGAVVGKPPVQIGSSRTVGAASRLIGSR